MIPKSTAFESQRSKKLECSTLKPPEVANKMAALRNAPGQLNTWEAEVKT